MNASSLKTPSHCHSLKAPQFITTPKKPSLPGNDQRFRLLNAGSDSNNWRRLIWKRAYLPYQWRNKWCQSDLKEEKEEKKEEKEGKKEEEEGEEKRRQKEEERPGGGEGPAEPL